jgi:hypothetical protein
MHEHGLALSHIHVVVVVVVVVVDSLLQAGVLLLELGHQLLGLVLGLVLCSH